MSEIFADYATRIAFNLTLSRPMISVLHQIRRNELSEPGERHYERNGVTDTWIGSAHSLVRRGLIEHVPNPKKRVTDPWNHTYWRTTEPGRLVHQLCVHAGLIVLEETTRADVPAVSRLPRKHARAGQPKTRKAAS